MNCVLLNLVQEKHTDSSLHSLMTNKTLLMLLENREVLF